MSAAAGGEPTTAISPKVTILIGVIGGLLGIYLANIIGKSYPAIGAILAGLGAVCAIVWGADAIRRVASYGLGTGVPSIGYMSLGVGLIGSLAGLYLIKLPAFASLPFLAPIFVVILTAILALVIGLVAKNIVKMKIPILETCTIEIGVAAALTVIALSTIIAGESAADVISTQVVQTGYIAVIFLLGTMAIQHPFNACLGPNETQHRTLKLAVACGFLTMLIIGILALATPKVGIAVIIIGLIGWIVSFKLYMNAAYAEAASVKWAGLWPKTEE